MKSGSNIEKLFAQGEFVVTGECAAADRWTAFACDHKLTLCKQLLDVAAAFHFGSSLMLLRSSRMRVLGPPSRLVVQLRAEYTQSYFPACKGLD